MQVQTGFGQEWQATALAGLALLIVAQCLAAGSVQAVSDSPARAPSISAQHSPLFVEAAESLGLRFTHFNGMTGEFLYPEIVGPGAALFDFDNDGDLDVYLVQGQVLGAADKAAEEESSFPPAARAPLRDRLYRHDTVVAGDGSRKLHFTDVTVTSGLNATGYGIGVASGDFDNDGRTDLYVMNFGSNQLFRNNGDGTFSDQTRAAGVDDTRLSVSATFFDFDRDGWLDLYVVNHVAFSMAKHRPCSAPRGEREYCSTHTYPSVPSRLFHNRGNGTFEDVSASSGIARVYGAGLGVIAADFNGDGWQDVYVANDGSLNQLWINNRDGTFSEQALLAGVAVNIDGAAEASMGVDAADFDGDGDEDLFMTHDLEETNTLYVNDGQGWFEDRSVVSGLGAPSQGFTGFGTAWFDYDNDGWLDLFVANGAVRTDYGRARSGDLYTLDQTNQVFANLDGRRFREVTQLAGPALRLSEIGRGAAFGDIDNDGDTDIVLANNNGPTRLFLNQVGNHNHWLGLRLLDRSERDALGAKVKVHLAGASAPLVRRARADGSYASANDPRILVGLGNNTSLQAVHVRWPSGLIEAWDAIPVDRYTDLKEGSGKPIAADLWQTNSESPTQIGASAHATERNHN